MVAALVIALAGCGVPGGPAPVRELMVNHYDLAAQLRESALIGDLAGVRRSAVRLADLQRPTDLGPERAPQLLPLSRAARDASLSESVDEAARASARVARSCGDCHLANGAGLGDRLAAGPAPSGGAAREHVAVLSRVSGLLWNGVAGPSDDLWSAGAEALGGSGTLSAQSAPGLPTEYVDLARARLQRLGGEAVRASGAEGRERMLGEIWATCAECHSRAGVG